MGDFELLEKTSAAKEMGKKKKKNTKKQETVQVAQWSGP